MYRYDQHFNAFFWGSISGSHSCKAEDVHTLSLALVKSVLYAHWYIGVWRTSCGCRFVFRFTGSTYLVSLAHGVFLFILGMGSHCVSCLPEGTEGILEQVLRFQAS